MQVADNFIRLFSQKTNIFRGNCIIAKLFSSIYLQKHQHYERFTIFHESEPELKVTTQIKRENPRKRTTDRLPRFISA